MLRIDTNLLVELGLGNLPEAEKNSLLKHIYETLEMRVGMRLADQMSNEQLDEFEKYFEAKDDAGAFKWLEANFPNYKDIVQEEFEKLKGEVSQTAPQILASSQASAPAQPAPVAEAQSPMPQPQPVQAQEYQQAPAPQPQPTMPPGMGMPQMPQAPQPTPQQQPMQQPQYQPAPQQPAPQPMAQPQYQPPAAPAPAYPDQQPPAGP